MKQRFLRILYGWMIHAALVVIVTNLAYVVKYLDHLPSERKTPWEYFVVHTFHQPDALAMILALIFIEVNYQLFFKRVFRWLIVLSCLLTGMVCCAIITSLNLGNPEQRILQPDLVLYLGCYAFLYAVVRNYLYMARQKSEILTQQTKNELDALKAQLNPHFLFNSLNYLYGTALNERATRTADGIDQLSAMMRYTITGIHENFVPLDDELKFIGHYMTLQQARLPRNELINVAVQLPVVVPSKLIAPLILLPFIENAFKYGISMDEACFVKILIEITGNNLSMEINNSIVHSLAETKGNNTGIRNTVRRLKLLYPDKFKLRQTVVDNEYRIQLVLSLTN